MTAVLTRAKSARKAKGHGHLRRAEILAAAERIFVQCGYEGATIRRIAEEVGVSSTALYMHFRDKSEILVEICEGAFGQLIAINTELCGLAMDPVLRVRRMLEAYMQFGLEHPNAYRLVFCSSPDIFAPEQQAAINALGGKTYELFRSAVEEIDRAGRLRRPAVDVAAQTSWAACHGMVSLLLTRPSFEWQSAEALTAGMLDAVFDGLATA